MRVRKTLHYLQALSIEIIAFLTAKFYYFDKITDSCENAIVEPDRRLQLRSANIFVFKQSIAELWKTTRVDYRQLTVDFLIHKNSYNYNNQKSASCD